ncbi:MAG TPA: aldehyde dehydrogenase [Chitinophagales bacterium]|nr:aldehyde dehydrogenase [Chitinophagales bacterium]
MPKQLKILNYINGKMVPPASGRFIDNLNPATSEVYSRLPDSDASDVDLAVRSAEKAFPSWSCCGAEKRAVLLNTIAGLIEKNLEEFALAETNDSGKPISLSRILDIPRAVSNFRFFASGIRHFASESHLMEGVSLNYTLRQPVGVAGCISPWNLPLYLFTWKIAPALAAGCCVVAKPSELTPMTAFMLSKICMDAGLPDGVLNIVHGYGNKAGQAICEHPGVKAISFTGGTATGKMIAQATASQFKKLSLEMGGKNPNIIFADCDFEKMLETTVRSSFSNQGQICLCGSRILVDEKIYNRFKKAFVEQAKKLKVGDPLDESVDSGSVISRNHFHKIMSYIESAKNDGGKILLGGSRVKIKGRCKNGYFIEPTIIEGLDPGCKINQEEVFGPVVTLIPFKSEDEALQIANSTLYGLASMIWTQDITRAIRVAQRIQTGIVWVNCWLVRDLRTPFGGMKNSGVGREGGWEALRFFTEAKNVCVKIHG